MSGKNWDKIVVRGATEVEVAPETQTDVLVDQPWQVMVLNDPVNLMSYVTLILQKVFGYSRQQAETLMREVHEKGKSIVWTGERERAEMYVQQLQGFQLLAKLSRVE